MAKIHAHYDNLKVARAAPRRLQDLEPEVPSDNNPGDAAAVRSMAIVNTAYGILSAPARRTASAGRARPVMSTALSPRLPELSRRAVKTDRRRGRFNYFPIAPLYTHCIKSRCIGGPMARSSGTDAVGDDRKYN